jgi:hypothetical protein
MFATFNRFEIEMTLAQAQGASHQGACDDDVAALLKVASIKRQLAKIPAASIAAELSEYGAWDDAELADVAANHARIVWIAAGNIVEEQHEKKRNQQRRMAR